jgi:hypothetical protein
LTLVSSTEARLQLVEASHGLGTQALSVCVHLGSRIR